MDLSKLQAKLATVKASMVKKDKTIKPQPGANRYIILPGWAKEAREVFYHEFGQHFIKNEAGEIQAVYPCLEATYGQPCPVCNGLAQAMKSAPDDATVEVLKEARGSKSFLFNVLALDTAEQATPQILEVRSTVFKGIIDAIEEWGEQIFSDETPQILVVNREGKGLNTKYTVQVSPKKVKMPSNVLDKLHDLDEYVKQTNEEQERKALGAIRNVAGLLPAPAMGVASASKAGRTATASMSELDDADDAALTAAVERPSSKSAAAPALDAELDDILQELETGA